MYDHPSQAEPYLPPFGGQLLEHAARVSRQAQALVEAVPADQRALWCEQTLRANAVFSCRLEHEEREEYLNTHERAERAMGDTGTAGVTALGSTVLQDVHRALYSELDAAAFGAGEWRKRNVQVQTHVPPKWEAIPLFMARVDQVYLQSRKSSAELLLTIAAAHHRLAWVHPFVDGNGRSVRLQSQCALRPFGSHLWSLSHGLWRRRNDYYRTLAEADAARLGDLDGRGNLSQKRLIEWCDFFVSVCEEEIGVAAQRVSADPTVRTISR